MCAVCLQCLRLTEEQLAEREVDVVDIAFDELAEKHYKVEEVRHRSFVHTLSLCPFSVVAAKITY